MDGFWLNKDIHQRLYQWFCFLITSRFWFTVLKVYLAFRLLIRLMGQNNRRWWLNPCGIHMFPTYWVQWTAAMDSQNEILFLRSMTRFRTKITPYLNAVEKSLSESILAKDIFATGCHSKNAHWNRQIWGNFRGKATGNLSKIPMDFV